MMLTNILNEFISVFNLGFAYVLPDAHHLLWMLATLELALAALWWAFDEGNRIEKALLVKIMQICFFIWIVSNYRWLIDIVIAGFVDTGTKAAGGTNTDLLQDPSTIIDWGFVATDPILGHLNARFLANGFVDLIFSGLAALLVLLAYFGLAVSAFITYLEFYIVSLLGLILIPFGVFRHTSFLSEKVFGAVIAFGIRLMVLAFILAVIQPRLQAFRLSPDPELREVMTLFVTTFTITLLSWHAPGVASGLMAGSPSIGAGTFMGTGLAAGAGIVGAGTALGMGTAMNAAKHGLGQVIAASNVSHTSGGSGLGKGSRAPGASAAGVSSSVASPSTFMRQAPKRKDSSMPAWAQNIMLAHHAIPQDAHPGAGMSVPIKTE